MKIRLLYLIVLLFAFNCEDTIPIRDNLLDYNNPNYKYSEVSGTIIDSRTNLPISECQIIFNDNDSTASDNQGAYYFENITHGSHYVLFKKDGYVTCYDTIEVEYNTNKVYNRVIIEDIPFMELSDTVLIFNPEEVTKTLVVTNSGTRSLEWNIDNNEESISTDINNGSINPEENQIIIFTVNKHMLAEGSHNLIVPFLSNGGSESIKLNILVEPFLVVTGDSILFDINDALTSTFGVANPGGGTLDFTITENISWLALSRYDGQVEGDTLFIEASVDTNQIDDGDNVGSIQITSGNGTAFIPAFIYRPFPPLLEISNNNLDFGLYQNELNFNINNGGDGVLIWNIYEINDWLSVSPQNGETVDEALVNVNVNRSVLYQGNYSMNMGITSNGGYEQVDITCDVVPILAVSENNFYFDESTDQLSFVITNVGSGIMPWSVDASENWIILSDNSGEITDDVMEVYVDVDQSGMDGGSYYSSIIIYSGDDQHEINVEMDVPLPPVLNVSASDLHFSNDQSETSIYITNTGEGVLSWNITENISWLTISPESGTTTMEEDEITITIYNDNLSNGEYEESFSINSNVGSFDVTASMTVVNPIYEDFSDLSEWYGDIGDDGWNITNSNNCQEPPCATVYFCAVCDEEDATINRQIWVEPGMVLELFTYGYWNLNLNIYLGGSLIAEINNSYSIETINHTITSSGQMLLTIVSEYNYLGSGYIDNLIID